MATSTPSAPVSEPMTVPTVEAQQHVETIASTTQPVDDHNSHGGEEGSVLGFGGLTFDASMVLLTWVAFIIAAVLLGKLIWKPILKFLEERESEIKESLEDAAKARKAAADADVAAAETLAAAERQARAEADAQAAAVRQHIATLEAEARDAIVARRKVAEADLAVEREATLRKLSEQAGAEIAYALERMLPGLLTEEQRQAYQEQIAATVNFH